ncbi:MAG: ClpXP protease specificity-enhancing factor [Burkholderiales bacterium]
MKEIAAKPYLLRAIYEWCGDSGLTPYLSVKVDQHTRVPKEYVKDGEIVLNISQTASRNLKLGNELIQFTARFNGVSTEISVPIDSVLAIFSKETGRGLFFHAKEGEPKKTDNGSPIVTPPPRGRRRLKVVK